LKAGRETEKREILVQYTMNQQANHTTQAIRMLKTPGATEESGTVKSGNTVSGWHGELG